MFTSLPQGLAAAAGASESAIAIAGSFLLALAIAWIYQKTHRGFSYSQSFVFTLIILAVLSAVTMLVIQQSLARAFALLGAFTIIRFRTAIKDTKDVAFIFWTLITGMAVGTGNYVLAIISTAALGLIILALSRFRFGSLRRYDHILNFLVATDAANPEAPKILFPKYLGRTTLLNVNARQEGRALEYTYNVSFLEEARADEFLRALEAVPGVSQSNLIAAREDIEY